MNIREINKSKNQLPAYSTTLSEGMYFRVDINQEIVLKPMERDVVKNGERIDQLVITKHGKVEWVSVVNLVKTKSGSNGFGKQGKNEKL